MCGLVGLLNPRSSVSTDRMSNALDALATRGPDDVSIWQSGEAILGHRRLSIVGIENGRQPMVSSDGRIAVCCNGEFYDYRNLKRRLCAEYAFQSESDSEILIPLYQKYGIKGMMKYLRGEFAFILYDSGIGTLYAVRDRFGIKPLCWWSDGHGSLIVASKAKAIFELGITPEWDRVSLNQALSIHYQPTDRTFFKNVRQVRPGYILCQRIGQNKPEEYSYWDITYPAKTETKLETKDLQESINETKELLIQSISLRLQGDVPVCCHLSGGLDSSAVAGIMSRYSSLPTHCFTIEFPEINNFYNESTTARASVERLGGVYHPVRVSQWDIVENLSDAVYYSEGLAVNGHLSCKYLLNKCITNSGFKVALTGEGADECFAGYPHIRKDLYGMMPENVRRKLTEKLYRTNVAITGTEISHGDSLNCSAMEQSLGFVPAFVAAKSGIGFRMYRLLSADYREEMLKHDYIADLVNANPVESILRNIHPVNASIYLWSKTALCNYILSTLGDGCEMACAVEGRLPYLDHHLFEFAAALPIDFKIKNGVTEKFILREAVRTFVTEEVYSRRKHPFQAPPLTCFFTPEIISRIRDELTSSIFLDSGIFDRVKVIETLAALQNMDRTEQTVAEPVIMLMLTICEMTKRFSLTL